jgi:hypothetical protein
MSVKTFLNYLIRTDRQTGTHFNKDANAFEMHVVKSGSKLIPAMFPASATM